ncbi:hypothetical protein DPMN_153118 [Dreissena polymorpha]|uniref:Uncharacterized protein n=1 Tax=Dreissena polymorpha TaxID=45954 RepID=A0A9D4FIJ9_DREPO|nr:hypothetical protein DPMN_153118 [Dreissena polymorpha]
MSVTTVQLESNESFNNAAAQMSDTSAQLEGNKGFKNAVPHATYFSDTGKALHVLWDSWDSFDDTVSINAAEVVTCGYKNVIVNPTGVAEKPETALIHVSGCDASDIQNQANTPSAIAKFYFCLVLIPRALSYDVYKQEHRLVGADRSSIFFLKVKGLSFSITKEGGVE